MSLASVWRYCSRCERATEHEDAPEMFARDPGGWRCVICGLLKVRGGGADTPAVTGEQA